MTSLRSALSRVTVFLAIVATASAGHAAARSAEAPAKPDAETTPALAAGLHPRIATMRLATPDGTMVAVGDILDLGRLQKCLDSVRQADAWPAAWLVVEDRGRPYDLVLRVKLGEDGQIATPDTAFLTSRRDWDDAALEQAVREATGKKPPRERSRNLVLQSFSKRTVTTYVYDLPATGKGAQGLLSMLPEGSLLRESRAVELGDGRRHTLAVILLHPRFLPSACKSPEDLRRGHTDAGGVLLVLAGETALEATVDLTEDLKGPDGEVRLPRYRCQDADREPDVASRSIEDRFGERELVGLLGVAEQRAKGAPVSVAVTLPGPPDASGASSLLQLRLVSEGGKRRFVREDG